ncbi:hypothetical protein BD309DRAFT_278112 [Dichomitus squalens]|nr:hypothetical protein BD309DRAFT_278112 [Dichomitus squalens]
MVWRRSCVLRSKSLVPRIRAARLCTHRREGCPLRHCEFSSSLCRNICRSRLLQNYDFPNNCEDYIHRIGRTGRAGMTGTSYTYFTTDNAKQARELIGILREAKAHVPPQLEEMSMFGGVAADTTTGTVGGTMIAGKTIIVIVERSFPSCPSQFASPRMSASGSRTSSMFPQAYTRVSSSSMVIVRRTSHPLEASIIPWRVSSYMLHPF